MRSNCRLCKAFVRVELQFGPFAVAQLRLLAEMQALTKPFSKKASAPEVNLFITNTLDNPFVEEEQLQNIVEAVARSRPVVPPVRYASRSFDRQWIIPDHRLLSMARPRLWGVLSDTQLFLTAIERLLADVRAGGFVHMPRARSAPLPWPRGPSLSALGGREDNAM